MTDLPIPVYNNGIPDQATLTEYEWFAVDWTAEQLYQRYHDENIDRGRREHALWRFWSCRIKSDSGYVLDDAGIAELMAFRTWGSLALSWVSLPVPIA